MLQYQQRLNEQLEALGGAKGTPGKFAGRERKAGTALGMPGGGPYLGNGKRRWRPWLSRLNAELAELGLPHARFDVVLSQNEAENGVPMPDGRRLALMVAGFDHAVFMVATNPGEPLRPLADIASGGETSRMVLALKSALKRWTRSPLLVFDEIDIGVGGRSAESVGRKLAELACYHQVICITHLPQIACFADTHIRVLKQTRQGRAVTTLTVLDEAR